MTHTTGPSQDQLAIDATGITKRFGQVAALAGVDLRLKRGATLGLIGPNGAGKTTFIKVLLGIVRADSGDVRLLGGDVSDVSVRRRVGYLPENLQLPPVLTATSFLRSIARLKGLAGVRTRAEVSDLVREALRRVGLPEEAWRRRMGGFSKGMRQRTGLASALLGGPDLLILDEPTDGIDPMGRAAIRGVIREETQRGATVFLNSHLPADPERLCDEIVVMAHGRVVRHGAMAALRAIDQIQLLVVDNPVGRAAFTRRGWSTPTADGGLLQQTMHIAGPEALSQQLAALLHEGVIVAEVKRDARSLEDVFTEAVGESP